MISVQNRQPRSSGSKLLWLSLLIAVGAACSPKTRVMKPVYERGEKGSTEKTEAKKADEKPEKSNKPAASRWTSDKPGISLILPFGTDRINREQPAAADLSKADLAIQFYQGFRLGLDSVASVTGQDIRLRIFDSGDDYNKLLSLSRNAGLRTSDLIVGPIFPSGIKNFASFSGSVRRPVLSPLSASPPSEFSNPYLISFTVPLEVHAREAAVFTLKKLKPAQIFIIRSPLSEELKYTKPFRQMIDSLSNGKVPVTEMLIKNGDITALQAKMSTRGNSVFVIPSTSKFFIDATLKGIDKIAHRYPVAVIGHPLWEKVSGLNMALLTRLNTRITTASRINYRSPEVVSFVRAYRSRFQTEPNEYAFKGFETANYFGRLISEEGGDFAETLSKNPAKGLSNNLEWALTPAAGWVNEHVFILRYDNLELKNEQ
ncbi:MAG: hypothetical protein INR69_07910 [Mucilaginibacter polytrichastri]|nr:hypothetical protein [Mucilaginibacter polytrichastri]